MRAESAFGSAESAYGSMVLPILGVRFFRAQRGKTAHEEKKRTALPKAKTADRVIRVIDNKITRDSSSESRVIFVKLA
jgi:hypothetical protein